MKIKDLPKVDRPREGHSGAGHRKRLRERFLQSGLAGFLDYEIVELLLTLGTPRRDCKQMAKSAIAKFGGLRGVLDASLKDLQQIKGIGPSNAFGVKLFQAVSERYALEQVPKKLSMSTAQDVAEYLQKSIGRVNKEHFVMLSLDSRYNLIRESKISISNIISIGSVNTSIVHAREIFKEAIQALAAQIIIAHNHPSGNLEPSPEDVAITRRLVEASRIIGIELLDHIIVTKDKFSSLKALGIF